MDEGESFFFGVVGPFAISFPFSFAFGFWLLSIQFCFQFDSLGVVCLLS